MFCKEDDGQTRSEEARLIFTDWMEREVSLFVRRSFPLSGANGAAVLHIVGGSANHPSRRPFCVDIGGICGSGFRLANFWCKCASTRAHKAGFRRGVVPQFSATPSLAAAVLPVALQAAAVCVWTGWRGARVLYDRRLGGDGH